MRPILLLYWGRRGAMAKFSLDLAAAVGAEQGTLIHFSLSRQSANFADLAALGVNLHAVDTFETSPGALTKLWRLPAIRAQLASYIASHGIETVIDLMPHVWSPLIVSAVHGAGARYIATVHDADAHPGDETAIMKRWIDRTTGMADQVITLSASVTASLVAKGVPAGSIATLFHPDMAYGVPADRSSMLEDRPLRFLFLGRIMPYKGLGLFVEAAEQLRASGVAAAFGVFGNGDLQGLGNRLEALGAEVANHWLNDDEIADALARFDVMVLSHVEASQSGVVATAFGAGMPVICTPVGALGEQVIDGITGLVASETSGSALAVAMRRLAIDRPLCLNLHRAILRQHGERSMSHFLTACASLPQLQKQS